jgi:argininosuccinate lyase
LDELPLESLQEVDPRITKDIFDVLSTSNSVASRISYGGTAPENVKAAAQAWLNKLTTA